jgi:hypothetical protein
VNEKLSKRLNRNIDRISDPTVKQLLIDLRTELDRVQTGPGEEDGPWAKGLDERAGLPATVETTTTPDEKESIADLAGLMLLMEKAAFIGIMRTYMLPKGKFPICVKPQKDKDKIVALEVELPDNTFVMLRSPECAEAPTSADATATQDPQP